MSPMPGGLTVVIMDDRVEVSMNGGGDWAIPLGPATLATGELRGNPPAPADLTNALGFVHDYFDDIIIAAPSVLATPDVVFAGPHALGLAAVELGHGDVPENYRLHRADADDVFRTLVVEPSAERLHNPGLDPARVDTILGTLCVVLAIMRRLDLDSVGIGPAPQDRAESGTQ